MFRASDALAVTALGLFVLVGCERQREYSSDIDSQIQRVSSGSANAILLCCSTNTDALVFRIEREAPEVKGIGLSGTDITTRGFQSISRLKQLKRIEIDTQFLTLEHVNALSNSTSLEEVIYRGSEEEVISRLRLLGLAD